MAYLADILIICVVIILTILFIGILLFVIYFVLFDRNQKMHSILRNYPVLGRVRYFFEEIGTELRGYWFKSDCEVKPFTRNQYEHIVRSTKYKRDVIGFGSKRDFEAGG